MLTWKRFRAGRVSLSMLAALACFAAPSFASDITGFLPAAGEGAVALGYADESYDEFWVGENKTSSPNLEEISTTSASLWLTWGFTDRLALIANVAWVDTEASGPAGLEDSGLQDATVLLASRLWQSDGYGSSHSLTGAVGVRTALESYEANAPVARGDETTDGLLRLVYMYRSGRFYLSQQVGYDLRSDEAPDGFPLYTELGYSAGRLTWIAGYSRLIADGGTDIGDPGFTFPSNKEEFERVSAKVVADVADDWAIFVGGFTTLDGRNSGDADGFFGGLIRRF